MTTAGLFFSLLLAWSAIWLTVLYEYSRATYHSWRAAQGTFRETFSEIAGFIVWYFDRIGGDLICLLKQCDPEPERPYNQHYDKGHYLRLFIGLGSFHSGFSGALTATADRSQWGMPLQALVIFSLTVSVAAGVGHLFVAWTHKQRRWRLTVLALIVWLPMAAVGYRMYLMN